MTSIDRLPPQNREAEEAVLGSLLIDPAAILDVSRILKAEDFYVKANGWIYEAAAKLSLAKQPVDYLTVTEELRKAERLEVLGGEPYLLRLLQAVPTSVNAKHYAHIVADCAQRRNLISVAGKIAQAAYDETTPTAEAISQSESAVLGVRRNKSGKGLRAVSTFATAEMARKERIEAGEELPAIPTPWVDLTNLLEGWKSPDLILVAARPGMGKTSMKAEVGLHAACNFRKRVAHFSLEMSGAQVYNRYISRLSGVDVAKISNAKMDATEWDRYYKAHGELINLPIFIDDSAALTPSYIRSECLRMYAEHGLDMVIIDYAGLMKPDGRHANRVGEQTQISQDLKNLAMELKVSVIVGLQLHRGVESRQDKRPLLSDLRDSGSWEQDADIVIMLYRDDYYNPVTSTSPNVAEVLIRKHRNGPTGQVELFWHAETASFRNLERKEVELPRL